LIYEFLPKLFRTLAVFYWNVNEFFEFYEFIIWDEVVKHLRGSVLLIYKIDSVVDKEGCEIVIDEEGEALTSALLTKYSVAILFLNNKFHDRASSQIGHQRKSFVRRQSCFKSPL